MRLEAGFTGAVGFDPELLEQLGWRWFAQWLSSLTIA